MAYQTGIATSHADFLDKLTTFAAANGFTLDEHTPASSRSAVSHAGSGLYAQWRWDGIDGIAGFQSEGFSGGTAPGSQTGDSGNGDTVGNVDSERRWQGIGAGPFVSYHFFASTNTQGFPYVHYVLESSAGEYRHGSFGRINIFGDGWGGAAAEKGAYHGMSYWDGTQGPSAAAHAFLFDGRCADDQEGTTIRCNNAGGELPNHSTSMRWFVHTDDPTILNDSGANPRERTGGGFREGFLANAVDGFQASPNSGFVAMVPVLIYYRFLAPTDRFALLGSMPDCRYLNGENFEPSEEISLGPDTWKLFPFIKKASSGVHSGNSFVAYKKVP